MQNELVFILYYSNGLGMNIERLNHRLIFQNVSGLETFHQND